MVYERLVSHAANTNDQDIMRRREFTTTLLGGAATLAAWPLGSGAQGADAGMNRRKFLAAAAAVSTWPLSARAQAAVPVIGFVGGASPELFADPLRAFRLGLKQTGREETRDFTVEERWARGRNDLLPGLVAELVTRQVNIIVPVTTPAALAAKAATKTIPVVFAIGSDPVKDGIVPSLNRPGRNVTGVTALTSELGPKRLEIIAQLAPGAALAVLVNPHNAALSDNQSADLQAAARTLGRNLHVVGAGTESELQDAFASLERLRPGGLVISADGFFTSHSEQLAMLALRYRLPTIYQNRAFVRAGGLMSYGASTAEAWRLAGVYAGRILAGEPVSDLPVQQASKVELAINLKTAKALGYEISPALLARADEVIE
jgi:putative ABC transport system substrate-binding protein